MTVGTAIACVSGGNALLFHGCEQCVSVDFQPYTPPFTVTLVGARTARAANGVVCLNQLINPAAKGGFVQCGLGLVVHGDPLSNQVGVDCCKGIVVHGQGDVRGDHYVGGFDGRLQALVGFQDGWLLQLVRRDGGAAIASAESASFRHFDHHGIRTGRTHRDSVRY